MFGDFVNNFYSSVVSLIVTRVESFGRKHGSGRVIITSFLTWLESSHWLESRYHCHWVTPPDFFNRFLQNLMLAGLDFSLTAW